MFRIYKRRISNLYVPDLQEKDFKSLCFGFTGEGFQIFMFRIYRRRISNLYVPDLQEKDFKSLCSGFTGEGFEIPVRLSLTHTVLKVYDPVEFNKLRSR
jgi:hypothetical protein